MWAQNELCSEQLRPDRVGVIFDKATDSIVIGSMINDEVRKRIPVIAQIRFFLSQGLSVVLHSGPDSRRHVIPSRGDSVNRVRVALAMCGVQ